MFAKTTLTVNHADDQVVAFLNGIEVFNRSSEENQQYPVAVDITDKLKSGSNALLIVGINFTGPAGFQGSLTIGENQTDWGELFPPSKKGLIWSKSFDIQTEHIQPPIVETVSVKSCPAIPADLRLDSSTTTEVIKWKGITYWIYTFRDNRYASAILGFDSANKFVARHEMGGARYISRITVDEVFETITLHGENKTSTFPWSGIG